MRITLRTAFALLFMQQAAFSINQPPQKVPTATKASPAFSPLNHIPGKPCEAWATVFIHGAVKGQFACWNLLKVWFDQIENTTYEKVVSILREDDFFWRNHAMQGLGLHKVSMHDTQKSGAGVIAHMFHSVAQLYQEGPAINYYYTFGWSGLLSTKIRYRESRQLYKGLTEELVKIKNEIGVVPKVRIVCFSHGGNVALNLAKVKKDEPYPLCLAVDELIFVGVPVQRETDTLIADDMFKKAYHFYSVADNIQTADFFSFKRFFSNRKFHKRSTFDIPEKLTQVSLKIEGYALRNRYLEKEKLPVPLPADYQHSKIKTIKTAPGHIEMWYLGWTPDWYRKEFPLFPLPVCVVIPTIINAINANPTLKNNLEVSLLPQREAMLIRNRRKPYRKTVPFLSTSVLESLKKDAQTVKPAERFYLDHRLRIKAALLSAKGDILGKEEHKKPKKKNKKRKKYTTEDIQPELSELDAPIVV